MKTEHEANWVKILPIAVSLLNQRPIEKLGNVAPEQINSFRDDEIIRTAQKESGLEASVTEPDGGSWKEQNKTQNEYLANPKNIFQPNSFVYLDLKAKTFSKSFEDQISTIFLFQNWRQFLFGGNSKSQTQKSLLFAM